MSEKEESDQIMRNYLNKLIEFIKVIKNDKKIKELINNIRSHQWVSIIELD